MLNAAHYPENLVPVTAAEISEFCRRNCITYLGLFGSAVRGEMHAESDYDILVEFEPDAPIGLIEYGRIQRELAALFGRRVDLVSRKGLKPTIRAEVLASAVDLYAQ